ncbi:hypothetical protein HAX54_036876 [Datura stramonium]|uniref:Uncharacterized protein n=1 Tax=Datura stramonium TaxID=4076 RepID=A0ABS8VJS2_DATST|nr:hypothetical protein [Datura stramonium]
MSENGDFIVKESSEFVQVTSDTQLLEFVKDLKDDDELDVFMGHEIDEVEELPNPVGLLLGPECNDSIDDVGINSDGNVENGLNPDFLSSESDNVIRDEDGSDVDEELRSFRIEWRNKRNPNPRREKKSLNKYL